VIVLLTAAKLSRASFDAEVYDGSAQGEKVYHTIHIGGLLRMRPINS